MTAPAVAFRALLWIAVIAGAKLAVGALTGSVAVLGDGLHSALDLALAGLTLFAVRLAAKPPDDTHPFGHGRAENLAALAQAVVMALVALGVGAEAVRRLFIGRAVDPPVYAVVVTAAALVIGIWRSTVLRRAAKRYSSPALEADAANLTADVVESLAVVVGLLAARAGVVAADPIAALVVVVVMFSMAIRIGIRAANVLMDRAPPDIAVLVAEAAKGVEGVVDIGGLRVRQSGPEVHAEVTISVGRTASVERSHEITEAIEVAVAAAVPGATTTVHVEPSRAGEDIVARTFAVANRIGLADQVHNVLAISHVEGLWLMLHAKVPAETSLRRAHVVTDELERELRAEIAGLARVEIHIEPRDSKPIPGVVSSAQEPRRLRDIALIAETYPPITRCHEVAITRTEDGLHVILHCEASPDMTIGAIHDASTTVESEIHRRYGDIRSITVHFEPEGPRYGGVTEG
ncbi:MAG: cation diffusion facilitator family transporter [Actinomycetota bacterium]